MEKIIAFFRKWSSDLLLGLPLILLIFLGIWLARCNADTERGRNAHLEQQHQLDSLNMRALRDSTLLVMADAQARTLTYERLATQEHIRADALDKKLKQDSKARIGANLTIAPAVAVITGAPVTVDAGDTLRAQTSVYQRPFHITASFFAPPSDSVRWKLGATIDPMPIGIRLGCATGPRGVHEARAELVVPDFVTANLTSVQQDAGICTDPIKPPKPMRKLACFAGGAGTVVSILGKQPIVAAGVGLFSVLFLC